MISKDNSCKTLCSSLSAARLSQRMREGIEDGNQLDATVHMEELLARKDCCSVRETIINAEYDGVLQPNTPIALMLGRSILDNRDVAFLLKDIGEVLVNGKSFIKEKKLVSDEDVARQLKEAKESIRRRQESAEAEIPIEYVSGPDQLKKAQEICAGATAKATNMRNLLDSLNNKTE